MGGETALSRDGRGHIDELALAFVSLEPVCEVLSLKGAHSQPLFEAT
jgi:hypothetical protein